MNGTVLMFDPQRCFGWIRRDDDGKRIFVHRTNVVREDEFGYRSFLVPGDRVAFELGFNGERQKPQAEDVYILATSIRPVESESGYVEAGFIEPPKEGYTNTYIRRPDGEMLYVSLKQVSESALQRLLSGESLRCTYRIIKWKPRWNGETQQMESQYGANSVEVLDERITDEELFLQTVGDVR